MFLKPIHILAIFSIKKIIVDNFFSIISQKKAIYLLIDPLTHKPYRYMIVRYAIDSFTSHINSLRRESPQTPVEMRLVQAMNSVLS